MPQYKNTLDKKYTNKNKVLQQKSNNQKPSNNGNLWNFFAKKYVKSGVLLKFGKRSKQVCTGFKHLLQYSDSLTDHDKQLP